MAAKPLTREEIANTEKKLDMPLDDIIKMSKNNTKKAKKQRRPPNKSQKFFNNPAQEKALKVRRYLDSRPFVRQGFLAQRRSNFQGNQFPLAAEAAKKAALMPFRNRPVDRSMVANSNKTRPFVVQKRFANGGFTAKQHQGEGSNNQRPKTLDSLFANMKEQRMKVFSRQNNAIQRNGNGSRPRVPWARGRFGN
ncbi:hypothetical protein K2173_010336 [Erythroxylum novogranatense]|uniref:Uncharacterized protein n=1 Tax=Erythroxylum novogranatense TaxID=1862640 RepID=A0AAV8TDJ9_9ROSI|nr:hypothetical protein K2173_010336 [Erythroxylum novogranatense]